MLLLLLMMSSCMRLKMQMLILTWHLIVRFLGALTMPMRVTVQQACTTTQPQRGSYTMTDLLLVAAASAAITPAVCLHAVYVHIHAICMLATHTLWVQGRDGPFRSTSTNDTAVGTSMWR